MAQHTGCAVVVAARAEFKVFATEGVVVAASWCGTVCMLPDISAVA